MAGATAAGCRGRAFSWLPWSPFRSRRLAARAGQAPSSGCQPPLSSAMLPAPSPARSLPQNGITSTPVSLSVCLLVRHAPCSQGRSAEQYHICPVSQPVCLSVCPSVCHGPVRSPEQSRQGTESCVQGLGELIPTGDRLWTGRHSRTACNSGAACGKRHGCCGALVLALPRHTGHITSRPPQLPIQVHVLHISHTHHPKSGNDACHPRKLMLILRPCWCAGRKLHSP